MAKAGMKIEGVERTIKALRFWVKKHSSAEYDVSYGAGVAYATYVHENLQARHPRGGQAKFLEQPARTQGNAIAAVTRQAVKAGLPLAEGLRLAAEKLLELSRQLVPVDTGLLKRSGRVTRRGGT